MACLVMTAGLGSVVAYEDGAPAAHSGGFGENDCATCHFGNRSNDPTGSLALHGLPERYQPGVRYALTLTLRHPELQSGGFQLSLRRADGISAGEFPAPGPRLELLAEHGVTYLQHNADGRQTPVTGEIRWCFDWQAPRREVRLVVHVAANAANDDLSALGDFIYTLERHIEPAHD